MNIPRFNENTTNHTVPHLIGEYCNGGFEPVTTILRSPFAPDPIYRLNLASLHTPTSRQLKMKQEGTNLWARAWEKDHLKGTAEAVDLMIGGEYTDENRMPTLAERRAAIQSAIDKRQVQVSLNKRLSYRLTLKHQKKMLKIPGFIHTPMTSIVECRHEMEPKKILKREPITPQPIARPAKKSAIAVHFPLESLKEEVCVPIVEANPFACASNQQCFVQTLETNDPFANWEVPNRTYVPQVNFGLSNVGVEVSPGADTLELAEEFVSLLAKGVKVQHEMPNELTRLIQLLNEKFASTGTPYPAVLDPQIPSVGLPPEAVEGAAILALLGSVGYVTYYPSMKSATATAVTLCLALYKSPTLRSLSGLQVAHTVLKNIQNLFQKQPQGFVDATTLDTSIRSMIVLFTTFMTGGKDIPELVANMMKKASSFERTADSLSAFVTTAIEMAEGIVNYLRLEVLGLPSLRFLDTARKDVNEFIDAHMKIRDEIKLKTFRYTEDNALRVHELWKKGNKLVASFPRGRDSSGPLMALSNAVHQLNKLRVELESRNLGLAGMRQEPVAVLLRGPPGVCKSNALQHLSYECVNYLIPDHQRDLLSNPDQCIFARYAENVHWDGYDPEIHKVVQIDDLGQARDVAGMPDNEWMNLIRMVNMFPYILHMAALEGKGTTYYRSNVFLANTNIKTFAGCESVISTEAVERRFDRVYDVCPKYAYCSDATKDSGLWGRRLDPSKLPIGDLGETTSVDPKFQEFHEFLFDKSAPDTVGHYTGKVLEFEQVVGEVKALIDLKAARHRQSKSDLMKRVQPQSGDPIVLRRLSFDSDLGEVPLQGPSISNPESLMVIAGRTETLLGENTAVEMVITEYIFNQFGQYRGLNGEWPTRRRTAWLLAYHYGTDAYQVASMNYHEAIEWAEGEHPSYHLRNFTDDDAQPPVRFIMRSYFKDFTNYCVKAWEKITGLISSSVYPCLSGALASMMNWIRGWWGRNKAVIEQVISMAIAMGLVLPIVTWISLMVGHVMCAVTGIGSKKTKKQLKQQKKLEKQKSVHYMGVANDVSSLEVTDAPYTIVATGSVRKNNGESIYTTVENANLYETEKETDEQRKNKSKKMDKFIKIEHDEGVTPLVTTINRQYEDSGDGPNREQNKNSKKTQKPQKKHIPSKAEMKAAYVAHSQPPVYEPQAGNLYDDQNVNILNKVARRNCYELWCPRAEKLSCFVTFVQGRVFMIPKHTCILAYHAMSECPEVREELVTLKACLSDVQIKFPFKELLNYETCSTLDVNDVVMIELKNCRNHGDITKYFVERKLAEGKTTFGFRLVLPRIEGIGTHEGVCHMVRNIVVEGEITYVVEKAYEYRFIGKNGDCGALFTLVDKHSRHQKILGIHTMGSPAWGTGSASPVYQEDVLEVLSKMEPQIIEPFEDEKYPQSQVDTYTSHVIPMYEHELKVSSHGKSKFKQTLMYGKWRDSVKHPARLHPFRLGGELINPMTLAVAKYGRNKVIPNPVLLRCCSQAYVADLKRASNRFEPKVLTFEEAILGIRDCPLFQSISRKTSPGFPHNAQKRKKPGKQDWFGDGPEYDLSTPECQVLRQRVYDLIDLMKKGTRPNFTFSDKLKDELRSLPKWLEGKTRLFSACPLELLIINRMYFGWIMVWLQENRINNGCAVGVNPYSSEWQFIASRLQKFGDIKNKGAGDYSGFDTDHVVEALNEILWMINSIYDDGHENSFIRKVLWLEVTCSKHIYEHTITQWVGSLPSGHPFTVWINTLINGLLFRYCWVRAHGGRIDVLLTFHKDVYLIILGDDHVYAVTPEAVRIFNERRVGDHMRSLGYTYTNELKGEHGEGLRSLDEVTFLKRGFRKDEILDRIVGPLSLDTILELPYWVKSGPDELAIIKSNVDNALMELSLHGDPVFEFWAGKIITAFQDSYHMNPEFTTRYHLVLKSNGIQELVY